MTTITAVTSSTNATFSSSIELCKRGLPLVPAVVPFSFALSTLQTLGDDLKAAFHSFGKKDSSGVIDNSLKGFFHAAYILNNVGKITTTALKAGFQLPIKTVVLKTFSSIFTLARVVDGTRHAVWLKESQSLLNRVDRAANASGIFKDHEHSLEDLDRDLKEMTQTFKDLTYHGVDWLNRRGISEDSITKIQNSLHDLQDEHEDTESKIVAINKGREAYNLLQGSLKKSRNIHAIAFTAHSLAVASLGLSLCSGLGAGLGVVVTIMESVNLAYKGLPLEVTNKPQTPQIQYI
ncbi:MAG: hypothetical protein ACQEP8_06550 [Chlamydiota bacterium]